MSDSLSIGFLGLGAMGARMARRLIDAGHTVTVWNRTLDRAQPLAAMGARVAQTPREAAEGAQIVISMVTHDEASRSIWLSPERGALAGLAEGAVAVESSTLTLGYVAELAEQMKAAGRAFLDAPVAGTRPQAEAGSLIYLVGGEAAAVAQAQPALEVMGAAVHHLGPNGAGARMKLAINAFFGVQVAAMAEIVGLVERAGGDREQALKVLAGAPITSPALQGIAGQMLEERYAPMFPVALVEKDFRYVVDAAEQVGAEAPLARATQGVFAQGVEAGLAELNLSAVARLYG